ncbi:MAG: carbohydrate ABC transporter permease [Chloroflexi bacterium]|nr:carbohydrate ABC transporter permease [Chloroflexota bacterium]MBU1747642.1 carbohydrate ABC transporter permease [Chloroflexota bacterium]
MQAEAISGEKVWRRSWLVALTAVVEVVVAVGLIVVLLAQVVASLTQPGFPGLTTVLVQLALVGVLLVAGLGLWLGRWYVFVLWASTFFWLLVGVLVGIGVQILVLNLVPAYGEQELSGWVGLVLMLVGAVGGVFFWWRVKRDAAYWFSAAALRTVDPAIYFLLIMGLLLTLFPFYWMILTSLKPYKEASRFSLQPTLYPGQQYVEKAWDSAPFPDNLGILGETLDTRVFRLWREGWAGAQEQFALAQTAPWQVEPDSSEWTARDYYGDGLAKLLGGFLPNYVDAWNSAPFLLYFRNTVFMAGCIVVGVLFTSALAGYAFARMEFFGRNAIFMLFLSTMMIPFEVIMIPNYVIVYNLGWYNAWPGLIVPWIVNVFSVFLFRQFFITIPKDLHDAALIDGCGHIRFLTQIILPLSKPAVITVSLLSFLGTWNTLLWPILVTKDDEHRPIQLGLSVFKTEAGTEINLLMAGAMLTILPIIILYLVAQRYFIEGIATSGLKG